MSEGMSARAGSKLRQSASNQDQAHDSANAHSANPAKSRWAIVREHTGKKETAFTKVVEKAYNQSRNLSSAYTSGAMDDVGNRHIGGEILRSWTWKKGFQEQAKAKPCRWWAGHHADVREVQLRTRWTSAEQSVRWKNACVRFAERSFSQMRDLFMGAHSQRHGWDAGHYDTALRDEFQSSSASLDTQDTDLYKDDLFEIFDADESFSSSHASSRQCGWNLSCPAVLALTVLCGRNLKAADFHGTIDPFVCIVRMHVGSAGKANSQQTKVLKKTLHPQWNESFNFEIDSASRHERLHLECFDQDMLSANDSLGKASLALAPLQPYQQREFWCRLAQDESGTTQGEVKVRCTLLPRPAGPANTPKSGGLPRSPGSLELGAPIYDQLSASLEHLGYSSSSSSSFSSFNASTTLRATAATCPRASSGSPSWSASRTSSWSTSSGDAADSASLLMRVNRARARPQGALLFSRRW